MKQRPITVLIATAFLLSTVISHAVNPDRSGPGGGCRECEDCQSMASADPVETNLASVDLLLNLGRAPFARSNNFAGMFSEAGANVGNNMRPQGLDGVKGFFAQSPVANLWKAQLYLKSDKIDAAVFSPAALTYDANQKMEILRDTNGVIRQVLTHDFLVDIQSFTDFASSTKKEGYDAKWYFASDKNEAKSGGFYTIMDGIKPVKTVTISNPTPQTYNTLDVFSTQTTPGITARQMINRYIFKTDPDNGRLVQRLQTWTTNSSRARVTQIAEDTLVYLSGQPAANAHTRIRTLSEAALDADGNYGDKLKIISRTHEEYADVSGLKRLVSKTVLNDETTETTETDDLTTTYGYYGNSNPFLHGRPRWQKNPDGSWTIWRITGDANGASITEITPFGNTPYDINIDPDLCRVETRTIKGSWMETSVKVLGKLVEHQEEQFFNGANGQHILRTKRYYDATHFLTTITGHNAFGKNSDVGAGRIAWVFREDGTASLYTYSGSVNALVVTETSGPATGGDVKAPPTLTAEITKTVTTYNQFFHPIAEDITDLIALPEAMLLSSWYSTEQDLYGRPTLKTFDDGSTENSEYSCCGLASMTDRSGATTTWSRDLLKRVYSSTHARSSSGIPITPITPINPITTTTAYDGLKTTVMRGDILASETTRSLDGLTTTTLTPDADGDGNAETTSRATVINAAGGTTTTTTYPDFTTTATTTYRDGQTAYTTDQENHTTNYTYGSHNVNGGGLWTRITAPNNTQWTQTSTDLLGRTFQTDYPLGAFSSTTYHGSDAAIGARGKPATFKDADETAAPGTGSFTEYAYGYDAANHAFTTTTEHLSDNQTRVTTTTGDVVDSVTLHGVEFGPVLRSTTVVNDITTSISYRSADGHSSGSASFGQSTVTTSSVPVNGAWTVTSISPAGQKTVQTHTDGLLKETELFDYQGTAPAILIASTSYTHDALARVLSSTDSRTGTTWFVGMADHDENEETPPVRGTSVDVMANGNPRYIEDPGGRATTFTYDSMGRRITIDAPDTPDTSTTPHGTFSNITHTSYTPRGEVAAEWGGQTYPTYRTYDSLGRPATLHTWRDSSSLDLSDGVTTAELADSSTTTWLYSPTRGWLVEKNHHGESDNGTTDPDYTYTLAGRLKTRNWERGVTTTYEYDHGMLETATYSGETNGHTTANIVYSFDHFGRVRSVNQGSVVSHTYAYKDDLHDHDNDPETDDEPHGIGLGLHAETIDYGTGAPNRTIIRHEDDIQRQAGWQLKDGGTVEHAVAYGYDTSGRLKHVHPAYPLPEDPDFTYHYEDDSFFLLSSVVGPAHTVTNHWEETRDVLDRKSNTSNVDTPALVNSYQYTVNAIGQRESVGPEAGTSPLHAIAWTWGYNARGEVISADHGSDSTANAKDRFYRFDAIGNRDYARNGVHADSGGTQVNYTANELNQYTGNDQNFSHDPDGNLEVGALHQGALTEEAGTAYTATLLWDAENRLVEVLDGETPMVAYRYDYLGRRISRTAGETTTWYFYDGFNCIAEYTGTTLTTRTWGLDLSGSLQGAGGVGGLLAVNIGGTSYYPAFDGNGNVSEYLTTSGVVAAHFEYDPFGNLTYLSEQSAGLAALFDYRFSTKPLDQVTGLYYYLYRWYDPLTGRWPSRDPIEEEGGINLYGFVGNNVTIRFDLLGLDALGSEIKRDWLERVGNIAKLGPIFGNLLNMAYKDYWYNDNEQYIVNGVKHGQVRSNLDVKYAEICIRKHTGSGKKEKIRVDRGENVHTSLYAIYGSMLERIETSDFWLGSTNPHAKSFGGYFDCCYLKSGGYSSDPEISNRNVNWDWIDVIDSNVGGAASQNDWQQVVGESLVWYLEVWSAIEFNVTVSFFDGRD